MIYCLSCKKPTKDINVKPKVTKNKRPYITANCDICKRLKVNLFLLTKFMEMDF